MRPQIVVLVLTIILLAGCYPSHNEKIPGEQGEISNKHARGFRIIREKDFRILEVRDPWQGSSDISYRYVLASDLSKVPDSLTRLPLLRTPVSTVVCMSTTHVAMIESLDMTPSIVGISGSDYITNPALRQRIDAGEIYDIGADQSLNYERIISLNPDVVIAYGITSGITGMVNRLGQLDIPVILNADYLENEPLGKTEWVKFVAELFEMEREADSIFNGIKYAYLQYRELVAGEVDKPVVMTGLPWKDTWYVPGNKSFAAAYIHDAGGKYVWDELESREAAPVDLESVFARASNADIWINCGSARSLDDIRQTDPRLTRFKPYREAEVYNNTAKMNATGGNDFWEKGVMEPHLVLADLIGIFHPEMAGGRVLRYYRKLR